jgi:hypothetical protein
MRAVVQKVPRLLCRQPLECAYLDGLAVEHAARRRTCKAAYRCYCDDEENLPHVFAPFLATKGSRKEKGEPASRICHQRSHVLPPVSRGEGTTYLSLVFLCHFTGAPSPQQNHEAKSKIPFFSDNASWCLRQFSALASSGGHGLRPAPRAGTLAAMPRFRIADVRAASNTLRRALDRIASDELTASAGLATKPEGASAALEAARRSQVQQLRVPNPLH